MCKNMSFYQPLKKKKDKYAPCFINEANSIRIINLLTHRFKCKLSHESIDGRFAARRLSNNDSEQTWRNTKLFYATN